MPDEDNPTIYVEYSADAFPPSNWTSILMHLNEFRVKNAGILKTPEAELVINNRNGRYTGNGDITPQLNKIVRIRADVRGTIDTLFYGRLYNIHSKSKKKEDAVTLTCRGMTHKLLRDYITKKYYTENEEQVATRSMKDIIEHFLATPDSAEATGISLVTDTGAITSTLAKHNFDRDTLLEAVNKIADYIGYGGYEEISGSAINLCLYPYGWQATNPVITITETLEREYETSIEDGFANHVLVWATPQAAYPSRDAYTEGGVGKGYWAALNGECTLSDDAVERVVNDKSVKITKSAGTETEIGATLTFPLYIDVPVKKLVKLCFALKTSLGTEYPHITLEDNWVPIRKISWLTTISLANRKYENGWAYFDIPLGSIYRSNQFSNWHVREVDEYPHKDTWGVETGSDGGFNWKLLKLRIRATVPVAQALTWNIDGLHFAGSVPTNPLEDTTLQSKDQTSIDTYGRTVMYHDAPEVNYYDVVHLLADSIVTVTKNPLVKLTTKVGAKTWAKPNQYVAVNMPVFGINADYRIVEIDFGWNTKTKFLRSTLSLTPRYQPVTSREWFAGLVEGIMKGITW